jgi:hypothetical protein
MLCSQKNLEKLSRRFKGLFHFVKIASAWGVKLRTERILPQLDEFCFTTAERNFWKIADASFRISTMTDTFPPPLLAFDSFK